MAFTEMQLRSEVSRSRLGRYEVVKLALEWIKVIKHNEDYRKLTQTGLIDKVLNDVAMNIATRKKIDELCKRMKKEPKQEAEVIEE
jgi:hypothetical protein